MCKYCEIDDLTNKSKKKFRMKQTYKVGIAKSMFEDKYFLEIQAKDLCKELIKINYCPSCGRRLDK